MLKISKNETQYSEEFKQQIVDLYQEGSFISCLSREYGVANVTNYKWIKELSNVKVSDTKVIFLREYEKMKKRINELEMENEILKKLLPYSQENDRRNRYLHRNLQKIYTVKRICKVLNFQRSMYYKTLLHVPSNREKEA